MNQASEIPFPKIKMWCDSSLGVRLAKSQYCLDFSVTSNFQVILSSVYKINHYSPNGETLKIGSTPKVLKINFLLRI